MKRLVLAAGCAALSLLAAACGSTAAGASQSTTVSPGSSTATGQGRGAGGGVRGEVVRIGTGSLILNTTTGDATVTYTAGTTVLRTSTAALADIQPGLCITAAGRKDAAGTLTVSAVTLTDAVNGACTLGGRGPGGPGASGAPAPDPSRTPRPSGAPTNANFSALRGLVKAVAGTSVTVTPVSPPPGAGGRTSASSSSSSQADQTITIPTTVTVSRTAAATIADIIVGDCVAAVGQKDASGVIAARALSIQPAGPTGCFTGGRGSGFGGAFGGFGGGGGGNGAGNE